MIREVVAALAVFVVAVCLFSVFSAESRRQGGLAEDEDKLRWLAQATDAFAAAHNDQFWGLQGSTAPEAAVEAVLIIRAQSGRPELPFQGNWVPHVLYNYLALASWLNLDLPDERFISSGDEKLLLWASDPANWNQHGEAAPRSPLSPYRTSFQMPPAYWSYPWSGSNAIANASQGHSLYIIPSSVQLGPRSRSEVRFPGHKVLLHDSHARHFPVLSGDGVTMVQPYFGYDVARIPLLFADGSVRVTETSETNRGWNPRSSVGVMRYFYDPQRWEQGTISGAAREIVTGHYRYTRNGLSGLDVSPRPRVAPSMPGRR